MNNIMSKTFGDINVGDKVYYLKDEFKYHFDIEEGVVSSKGEIKENGRVRIKIKIDGMKTLCIHPLANEFIEFKYFSHVYTLPQCGTYIVSDNDKFKELMNSIVEYKEALIETQTKMIEKLNKFAKEMNSLS